jgi:DNA (cytosine-5)-methyltransferase 1
MKKTKSPSRRTARQPTTARKRSRVSYANRLLTNEVRESQESCFTFIDLFAGIGGFRWALEKELGGRCVFSCEWDPFSQQTYRANFGHLPEAGDIRLVDPSRIPAHDILAAGFPCQPFSIAGVSKKRSLGRPDGFADKHQGNLFFELEKIIRERRPRAFLLENVRNLRTHDGGNTFRIIVRKLTDDLGYDVHWKVIDARNLVPQHRERIFFVGFSSPRDFAFPAYTNPGPVLGSILDDDSDVPPKYRLTAHLWNYLKGYAEKHRAAGNGFGFGLVGRDDVARTLSARYYKDGSEILIDRGSGRLPRRLTPRECARLMGFPEEFQIPVSDTQAYKQFGNAVVVPLVRDITDRIVRCLNGETFSTEISQPRLFAENSRERAAS